MPNGFYVYLYLREKESTYGREESPYYVGKGSGKRAWNKFRYEVKPPKNKSLIQIVADGLIESEAFLLEKNIINFYGRIDLGSGCLRNQTDGGDGLAGVVWTDSRRQLVSNIMKEKWQSPEFKFRMSAAMKGKTGPKIGSKRGLVSEAGRRRMSEAAKGRIPWNKGLTFI